MVWEFSLLRIWLQCWGFNSVVFLYFVAASLDLGSLVCRARVKLAGFRVVSSFSLVSRG